MFADTVRLEMMKENRIFSENSALDLYIPNWTLLLEDVSMQALQFIGNPRAIVQNYGAAI